MARPSVLLLTWQSRVDELSRAFGGDIRIETEDASCPFDVVVAGATSRQGMATIRNRFPASAVLVVTSGGTAAAGVDAVGLLEGGADALAVDAVPVEVAAYVRALLRRRLAP
jgi:hypothetical protein